MTRQSSAMWSDPNPGVTDAQAELVAGGVVMPLALGSDEEQLWLDCDLASLAENRLGDSTDPRALDDARRTEWLARAVTERPWLPGARVHARCYWLLARGECAGTIAIATHTLGARFVEVTSLYVFANHRGRGTASAALQRLRRTLGRHGLGLRLGTSWTWQHAVRFYLRIGMWARSWKHDLRFQWHIDTSAPLVEVGHDRATLSIRRDRSSDVVVLMTAERTGERLRLHECDGLGDFERLRLDAMSTLGLTLALRGWPLVRSPESWDQCRFSDLGSPESLAHKIAIWEAWSRAHGWRVETPSIPGLDYPTWDALQAEWSAEA